MNILSTSLILLIANPSTSLIDAYKKELAFLEAERKALKTQLSRFEKSAKKDIAKADSEIVKLQGELLSIRNKTDASEITLREIEGEAIKTQDRADILSDTVSRSFESLERAGIELPELAEGTEGQVKQFDLAVGHGKTLIEQGGQIRYEDSEFFSQNGQSLKGKIVKIGNVAAYGMSGDTAGALSPAGSGRLRVWHQDAKTTATSLLAKRSPETLSMFVFADLEKPIEQKVEKTALDLIESGGVIAWAIVYMGLLGLALIFWRGLSLVRIQASTKSLTNRVVPLVENGKVEEALELSNQDSAAASSVMSAILANLHRDYQALEDLVHEATLGVLPKIQKFSAAITVIAAVAPLMGLLGTVTGMMSTFDVITEHGTGDPKMLAGGISEALVTTELGLIVAIPTLLLGTMLMAVANRIESDLDKAALTVMNSGSAATSAEA